jgi:hypothetical protein
MLRAPARRTYLPDTLVDLHKGPWTQQRMQREILQADVAIKAVAKVQALDQ